MNVCLKIDGGLLDAVRADLHRPHSFAHERVGFLLAAAASDGQGGIMLLVRGYQTVADDDYEWHPRVGAQIGSNAMRKAAQASYRPPSAILHVHTHGGRGRPGFSRVDLESAASFVPGFAETAPRMPHGLLVLSNDSVHGLLWAGPNRPAFPINSFKRISAPIRADWSDK